MSQILQIELPDALFFALQQRATAEGKQPEHVAREVLEDELHAGESGDSSFASEDARVAQERFECHIGTWDLGRPLGTSNDQIDADLSHEYGHEMDS